MSFKQKKQKRVPSLRFPEFEGEWDTKTLDDYFTFKNGINAPKSSYGDGYKFINVLDIIDNNHITYENIRGKVQVEPEMFEKSKVEYGDVLFQRSSETREEAGQSNIYLDKSKPATFGGFVIRGKRIREYNPIFINYLLKTSKARKEIVTKSGGSTRFNVGQKTLGEVIISITENAKEQDKIASFLTAVDKRITQLTKKKKLLEEYKKGVMQKAFPKEGEKVPEVRFSGFEGEWEEKKLGAIAIFSKGKGISKADLDSEGRRYCIRYGELYTTYGEVISSVVSKVKDNIDEVVLSQMNDVIMPSSGETQMDIATASCVKLDGIAYGGDLIIIRSPLSGVFLSYYLNHRKKRDIARLSQGISVIHLYASQLSTLTIGIPEIKEQNKIASFLSAIDDKISSVGEKIERVGEFKKGLLQGMFI